MLAIVICSGVPNISHWSCLDETGDIVKIREDRSDGVIIPLFGLWASRKGKARPEITLPISAVKEHLGQLAGVKTKCQWHTRMLASMVVASAPSTRNLLSMS
jgi:hypothetical protein